MIKIIATKIVVLSKIYFKQIYKCKHHFRNWFCRDKVMFKVYSWYNLQNLISFRSFSFFAGWYHQVSWVDANTNFIVVWKSAPLPFKPNNSTVEHINSHLWWLNQWLLHHFSFSNTSLLTYSIFWKILMVVDTLLPV